MTSKNYNNNPRYTYQYDASGNIGYSQDLVNGVNYRYVYDLSNRLVEINSSDGSKLDYQYDVNNNTTQISDKIGTQTAPIITRYDYDKDNRQKTVYGNNGSTTSFVYDILGRLQSRSVSTGTANYTTSYQYESGSSTNSTTSRLSTITNNGSPISYTHDANGNIKTVTQGSSVISYTYDELNEVTREDNQVLNKSIVYAYDAGGNLLSKTEYPYTTGTLGTPTRTYNYSYGDSNWKDKLTSYDGNSITYDTIGNPLTYNGWTYAWEEGRQLSGMSSSGTNISYKYNDDGIRTQKTVNGVTTKYHLVGDEVTSEINGTDTINYTYDASGDLVSMNLNGVEYYYIYDGMGNIIGLFDSTGAQVVSYIYDTWGKLISITGSLANTVGVKNPYRYRGYRYDTETGLYYLQSRYYNPEWGRFINADALGGTIGTLLSHNVFAYAMNNPVNMDDQSGNWPQWLKSIAQGIVDFVQGVGAAVMEDLSFGATSTLDPYYARENEIVYSVGKIVGHTGSMIAGAAGTVVAGGAAFITSPTGFGVIVCGSAAAVSAGVAVSAATNLAKDTMKFANTERMGRIKGNAPRSNNAQNAQFRAVAKEFRLSDDEQRLLHQNITQQGYGYQEIREEAIRLFPRLQK